MREHIVYSFAEKKPVIAINRILLLKQKRKKLALKILLTFKFYQIISETKSS